MAKAYTPKQRWNLFRGCKRARRQRDVWRKKYEDLRMEVVKGYEWIGDVNTFEAVDDGKDLLIKIASSELTPSMQVRMCDFVRDRQRELRAREMEVAEEVVEEVEENEFEDLSGTNVSFGVV